ncbi:hypothetical protein GEZ65_19160 [Escherichia albertii]|nr:hypothetical protein [Escherichia albertii]
MKPSAVLPSPALASCPIATLDVPLFTGPAVAIAPLPMAIQPSVSGVPPAASSALLPPSPVKAAYAPNDDNNPPATSAEINNLLRPLFFPRLFAVSLATL